MTASSISHPLRTIRTIAADIKLAHSVFAMPFALLGAFMAGRSASGQSWARGDWKPFAEGFALVMVCMVLARTVAMLSNRVLDDQFDRANPRTAGRAIPSGRLSTHSALTAIVLCAAAFMLACAGFGWLHGNWWPVRLGVPVLVWISAYPLMKRWTWLCHVYLGSSLAMSPIAAAIAMFPEALSAQPALWCLAGAVLCWVAGFDVLYALQDVEVDQRDGLYSIPSRLGVPAALWISRALHAFALAMLIACLVVDPRLDALFALGVGASALLLVAEHIIIACRGVQSIHLAFFTLNGMVSCVLGVLGIADVMLNASMVSTVIQ